MIGKGIAKGAWTNSNATYNHVFNYVTFYYPIANEINLLSLDLIFVKKLYQRLRIEKRLSNNSSIKNIANLRKVIITCVDNGWLIKDPFEKFKSKRDKVEVVYLTKEEIQAIANKEIDNDRLNRVRDLFIFCCFTGLSFIDVKQLKRSEIAIDTKGELRIYKGGQKTGTPAVNPVIADHPKDSKEICKRSPFYCTGYAAAGIK